MRLAHLFSLTILALLVTVALRSAGSVTSALRPPDDLTEIPDLAQPVARLNAWFQNRWRDEQVVPAGPVDELTLFRRLSLALFGAVPSLEEIRTFEQDQQPNRPQRWLTMMLKDARFSDYFADRLARSLVGVEQGPFIIFRRDRLRDWLAEQLQQDASWSQMTRELIAAEGLWTDRPAANFITIARMENEELDENKLAGRTVRTFLGQRMDCAQCHDHPFDEHWKQSDFEGLAAWYCQADVSLAGVSDSPLDKEKQPVVYQVTPPGRETADARVVPPSVPFHQEWVPESGSLRQRLANWITHPDNQRFERAIANRIWGLMFGRPWHTPVDDLPHPDPAAEDALDILGQEFRQHGERLSVLIFMIAMSEPFQRSSASPVESDADYHRQAEAWAVFPLVRLRPEQVIGSLFQAGRIRRVHQDSHPLIRLQKLTFENDFVQEYGDAGEDELTPQAGTISQTLLKMNGRFSRELSKVDLLTGPSEILSFSPDDSSLIDNAFLMCLTRRPSADEQNAFLNHLQGMHHPDNSTAVTPLTDQQRAEVVEDLFWALFNSPEFAWNH